MYDIHYNNSKKFTEAKFRKCSKQSRELRDKYTDDIKEALKNLSELYYNIDKN